MKPRLVDDAAPLTGVETFLRSQDSRGARRREPSPDDVLQELLAFATLSQQVHTRAAMINRRAVAADAPALEFSAQEFGLDEVLRLVTDYAVMITAADGVAIALAEDDEIVLRASAGTISPDLGARIDRDSAFSGACIRSAQLISSDDTHLDSRVNQEACRQLGARSMVAVPLEAGGIVFGLLEAFSEWASGFTPEDFRNLILLAELVSRTLTPEDELHLTKSARMAAAKLEETDPPVASPADAPDVAGSGKDAATQTQAPPTPKDEVAGDTAPDIGHVEAGFGGTPIQDEPVLQAVATAPADESTASLQERVVERRGVRRPSRALLLSCVGIAAALVAGIWWMHSRRASLTTTKLKMQSAQPAPSPAPIGTAGQTAVATAHGAASSANAVVNRSSSPGKPARANVAASSGDTLPAYRATVEELQKLPRVTGIQPSTGPDSTTVVITLESQTQYEAHRLIEPDRIYFDLPSTQLPHELFGKSIEFQDSLLKRIRVSQPVPGLTRVVLETQATPTFSVSFKENPNRLVVVLHPKESQSHP